MVKKKFTVYFIVIMLIAYIQSISLQSRSVHRPLDVSLASIKTCWLDEPNTVFLLEDSHLQEGPFFYLFDQSHFNKNVLPSTPIAYRNEPLKEVYGNILSMLAEKFLQEINIGKRSFQHFTILKDRDFNYRSRTGLIIAKFNDYPFVVKLFIETPESFVNPLTKGFEPTCFFMMGGGINRHLCGLTRIKNLHYLKKKIESSPHWRSKVSFPRKWFWLPTNARWIKITSENLGSYKTQSICIPSTYAVIADYIDIEKTLDLFSQNDRRLAMNLSNYLEQNIDPHINNYAIEKKTNLIVPLDTEHFLSMVGCERPPVCKSYVQWYFYLSCKMLYDTIGRTKYVRQQTQKKPFTRYTFLYTNNE